MRLVRIVAFVLGLGIAAVLMGCILARIGLWLDRLEEE